MAITKAMLKRCQNELKQAFCALDADVQKAIVDNGKHAQCLQNGTHEWVNFDLSTVAMCCNDANVWRLSPDMPTEPEYEECDIRPDGIMYNCYVAGRCAPISVSECVSHRYFLGIIYRAADGTEFLQTSCDAAFGVPVRVRFSKEVAQ